MNTSAHLVRLSKTVRIPADRIFMIMDYSNPFARKEVCEGKKQGIVMNLTTEEKREKNAKGPPRKRSRTKCVVFLKDDKRIITLSTSADTIAKRYEEALRGDTL